MKHFQLGFEKKRQSSGTEEQHNQTVTRTFLVGWTTCFSLYEGSEDKTSEDDILPFLGSADEATIFRFIMEVTFLGAGDSSVDNVCRTT